MTCVTIPLVAVAPALAIDPDSVAAVAGVTGAIA